MVHHPAGSYARSAQGGRRHGRGGGYGDGYYEGWSGDYGDGRGEYAGQGGGYGSRSGEQQQGAYGWHTQSSSYTHSHPPPPPNPYHPNAAAATTTTPANPDLSKYYSTCWRPTCQHRKCLNCALYAGPLGRADPAAKLLIRTVGGLYASPRYIDPVFWECSNCSEWECNRFDSRSTLGATPCRNRECLFREAAGRVGMMARGAMPMGFGMSGFHHHGGGCGVLTAESVVLNRYGERLGTADQRIAVADGPWDWQRRALGDPRCAVVPGLRDTMKRMGEGMHVDVSSVGGRSVADPGRLWRQGEPVPPYPYRRPPPVDGNDTEENNEYEDSYLAGMPTEPLDKGKGPEQQYVAPSGSPRFCPAPNPAVVSSSAGNPGPQGYFPGWNGSQM
ncbi:hypothetical protein VTI74DRAFT_9597 [Chaetomium olivicolor]